MEIKFQKFQEFITIDSKSFNIINHKLRNIVKGYSFLYISSEINLLENKHIYQNIKESNAIIIGHCYEQISKSNKLYFILSFQNTIIFIIDTLILNFFHSVSENNPNIELYFISEAKNHFDQRVNIIYKESIKEDKFESDVLQFNKQLSVKQPKQFQFNDIWNLIVPYISSYLLKHSYIKTRYNRIGHFYSSNNRTIYQKKFMKDDYVELHPLGNGSLFETILIYQIENEELLVIKKPHIEYYEIPKLIKREIENYSKINFPFIPKFYGTTKIDNIECPVIEYINGVSLKNIKKLNFSLIDKITIISHLLAVFEYLHEKNFIYRDLKPDNIIIDYNKALILIDFDRMIINTNLSCQTVDLSSPFLAPEINYGNCSKESDIYSIGQMIFYIINEEYPKRDVPSYYFFKNCIRFLSLYQMCTYDDPKKRVNAISLTYSMFYNISFDDIDITYKIPKHLQIYGFMYQNKIDKGVNKSKNQYYTNKLIFYYSLAAELNDSLAEQLLAAFYIKGIYVKQDINKAIYYLTCSANNNNVKMQFELAITYLEGKYIKRDINKAMHYFNLAADQNHSEAQFYLGIIYYDNKYINQDINKSLYYFSLAANQKNSLALRYLGIIYNEGQYITRDINKAIYYYSLAANQNDVGAQFNLGLIYYKGKYVKKDINKAIYYYSLAANQNDVGAQFNLGSIYYNGTYVTRDINKAIYFFSLAANQNNAGAQYNLGLIYYDGKYVKKDIKKVIYYFSLAAKQNQPESLCYLGIIYLGNDINQDINKAIYYFSLSSNQNLAYATHELGLIYYDNKYIERDINKSMFYFTYAAKLNYSPSQYILGKIYTSGQYVERNIIKGIDFFIQSSSNGNVKAHYAVGFYYHQGKYVERNMQKAIFHYKEASSFNNQYAKNNLGIIYKNGIKDEIPKNLGIAISYFDEAIKRFNDKLAMYNLAHIYIYEDKSKIKIDESIKLLIKLKPYEIFYNSCYLICIAMIKKHGFDLKKIKKDIDLNTEQKNDLGDIIINIIKKKEINNHIVFDKLYKMYKKIDFIYGPVPDHYFISSNLNNIDSKQVQQENKIAKNISDDFYEGFGSNF